ncbi:MAG: hypothetical protein IJG81_08170 [Muribaculaceae bacterium]|nr:hypothetical protein [Muribaculaceae bacterium]
MKHLFKVTILTLAMLCCYTMISEAKVKKTRKARTEKRITKTPSLSSKEIGSETMNDSQKTTNEREYVDLGLPSGTLWATCNVGASSPYEAGSYFAWGETTPKQDYSLNSYKWYNTVTGKYTKYCDNSSYGVVDNKTELELADDAAYVNWGKNWRMPTKAQFDELRAECTWQWNGSGYLVTSKKNGATLILPAAGGRGGSLLGLSGSYGYYWSRSLYPDYSHYAFNLYFHSGHVNTHYSSRFDGQSVRAVRVSQN